MFRVVCWLPLLLLALPAQAAERHFILEMQGRPLGRFSVSTEPAGEGLVRRTQRTFLRLGPPLAPSGELEVTESTVVEAATGHVRSARREQTVGGERRVFTAAVEDGAVVFGEGTREESPPAVDLLDGPGLLAATAKGPAEVRALSLAVAKVLVLRIARMDAPAGFVGVRAVAEGFPARLEFLLREGTGEFAGLVDLVQGVTVRPGTPEELQAAQLLAGHRLIPLDAPLELPRPIADLLLDPMPVVAAAPARIADDLSLEEDWVGDAEAIRAGLRAAYLEGDAEERARRLRAFLDRKVAWSPEGGTASTVLARGAGDEQGRNHLLAALCRAAGVPARILSGFRVTRVGGGAVMPATTVWTWGGDRWHGESGPAAWFPAGFEAASAKVLRLRYELAGELPFEPARKYRYDYFQNGSRIGGNDFTFHREEDGWRLEISTSLGRLTARSTLVTDLDARPRSYVHEADGPYPKVDVEFLPGLAKLRAAPADGEPMSVEKRIPPGTFFFDNNSIPHWALFLARIGIEPGESLPLTAFHPHAAQLFPLHFRAGGMTEIEWAGRKVRAFPVRVTLSGHEITFWLDGSRRLLRDEEGGLTIDLVTD